MYTSVYGRLCHDPVRQDMGGSGLMSFCYLAFQVLDGSGESTWYGMHIVAFGDVAETFDEYQEDDYVIVSGPTVPYRALRDVEIREFEVGMLVDSVRVRDGESRGATMKDSQPELGPGDEVNSIEGSKEAKLFDDDLPN